ncbi:MAG: DUF2281 domain-containing protein [Agitococcus sp.]|jgi:hypothetical protein|nr:DUF2281 domain-containing protein [Moraxellaceae bacterium]MBP9215977.1 DUF2281 domain-containing protein [Agitococcus sp.]MBK8325876.1 DUF2281 domain-containing protein [Moraxellaceae bacterium]MBK9184830.1 DUF2281 domain-containing protein [Moraxellaceae bacterium]MBL0230344.1 DUF2281 domain-containing protein [Moraxellaceae bacterium]
MQTTPSLPIVQTLQYLQALPNERQQEVIDFIEFLYQREQHKALSYTTTQSSQASLATIWDNDDDASYDTL